MSEIALITLLTDFGTRDPYVGAVSGAILSINPTARLVTITHEIPPQDIAEASFCLAASAPFFPPESVHLAIVDPGVGSRRRALVLEADRRLYVGPDNGIFTGILEGCPAFRAWEIAHRTLGRESIHPTFHARDLFAPVAAQLTRGLKPKDVGPRVDAPIRLHKPDLRQADETNLRVRVTHVDRFGNLILALDPHALEARFGPDATTRLRLAGQSAPLPRHSHYAEGEGERCFLLLSSSGGLEIARYSARADELLGVRAGDEICFELQDCQRSSK